jgi:hypothetical protein
MFNDIRLSNWVLLACLVSLTGCAVFERHSDPLAGWTFYSFPNLGPPYLYKTKPLDQAIIDDYQSYIKKNDLYLQGAIGGFYEDGAGQRAVGFTAFPPQKNATWNYVLIYDNQDKRVKVIRYGYVRYQS